MGETGFERFRVGPDRLAQQLVDYSVIVLDESGTIESWNAGAELLSGYTAPDAIGRSFAMLYAEAGRRRGVPLQLLDRARRDGRVSHHGWRIRQDGTRFWGDVVVTAVHDELGSVIGYGEVTRDVTVQHELEQSLRRNEERFRLLVSQVKDYAIIALDPSGTIESWNAGAERLKGYPAEEAIGRSFSMFYGASDRRAGLPLRLLTAARADGRVEHTGWRIRRDGTRFWADVIITALYDEQDRLTGFAKVTRDLSERKRMEDAQASFLGTIAHDFRTPITAMRGFTELARAASAVELEEYLSRIDANADRLMQMMKDLIECATGQSTSTTTRPETLDLAALARDTVANMGSDLDLARVVLPPGVTTARVDRSSMERIIINLVGNALKYSTSGPISVAVSNDDDNRIRLSVSDEGRGIDPDDLPAIFDEFERGRLCTADGGSGLGLTSVRQLAEEQGGRAHIRSVVGEGTVVTVELPPPGDTPLGADADLVGEPASA